MHVGMKLESDFLTSATYRRLFHGRPFHHLERGGLEFIEFPIRADFNETHYRGFALGTIQHGMKVSLHPYPEGIFNPAAFEDHEDNPCRKFAIRCLRFGDEIAREQEDPLVMTFHAASSARTAGLPWAKEGRDFYFRRSRAFFEWLSVFIRENDLQVKPMAELQLTPRPDQPFLRVGDTYDELLALLADLEGVEICWDMGHGIMNGMRIGLSPDPPEAFVRKVGHVHLHDIHRGRDHHPLLYGHVPYRNYLRRLKGAGFSGKINLELTASGIYHAGDFQYVLGACIEKVKEAWREG